jgi:diketogulonate reductase-like aldo/keto reductase
MKRPSAAASASRSSPSSLSKRAAVDGDGAPTPRGGACVQIKALKGTIGMPRVGFGTYRFKNGTAQRAAAEAVKSGYRLLDTAYCYGGEKTEGELGAAIKAAASQGVPRSELFVTTKHWRAFHGYAETCRCLDTSLKRLGLACVDLYLIHWPGPAYTVMGKSKTVMEAWKRGETVSIVRKGHDRGSMKALRAETWRAMEDALKLGKCRAIGVSNFTVAHLEALKETATIWPPAVNQVQHESLVWRQRRRLF